MVDAELARKGVEAEILLADGAVVDSHAAEPESYGAGFDAGYVPGLRKALAFMRGAWEE